MSDPLHYGRRMNRKQPIKVGNLVWVEQCKAHDLEVGLPEGLNDGLQVRVLAYEPGKSVKVQTEDARVFDVDPIHVDTGWIFQLGGKTFGEHTARAKAHVKKMIAEVMRTEFRYPDISEDLLARWRGVLARNGRRGDFSFIETAPR